MSNRNPDLSNNVMSAWVQRYRRPLLLGGPFLLGALALAVYLWGGRYVSTDDAYVEIAKVEISSNISARVIAIDVRDNQPVKAGTVLFKLDPDRFLIAAREAQAALAAARLKVRSLQAAYRERLADQNAASQAADFQQREYDRQRKLEAEGISSRAQLERSQTDLASARQKLLAAEAQTASALSDLNGNASAPVDSQPVVRQAQAALDQARLDLANTIVRAPIDGVVTQVEHLQVGNYVNAAAPLFALLSSHDLWVEANFKETDLADMRPGQPAEIAVDAFPAKTLRGRVESTSPGTGSSFSLLPPENSSGNWVKVVQRLPVRLSIDRGGDAPPLASGMSATVTVDTGRRRLLLLWN